MADYKVTDTELASIANAIRTKGGTQSQLEFPTGFVSAVQAIPTGGGGGTVLASGDYPSSSAGQNGDIYLEYASESGWKYLVNSIGSPYIDSGVPANTENLKIEITMEVRYLNNGAIFGGSWAANGFFLMLYVERFRFHSGGVVVESANNANVGQEYHIIATKDKLIINDVEYTLSQVGNNVSDNIALFWVTSGQTASQQPAASKMGEVKIYSGNTLIRDFVPSLDSQQISGMFEKVNSVFYYNIGAAYAKFSVSDNVSVGTILDTYAKVNGVWQPLIGTNISDINLGGN